MKFNFTLPWGQLKEACVGAVYPEHFFSQVKDKNIRSHLDRILCETIEDLDNIANILKSLGIRVHRPVVPDNVSVTDFVDEDNKITASKANSNNLIPRPPLQVRDSFFICDDTLYQTRTDGPYIQTMIDSFEGKKQNLTKCNFDAPLVTVNGDELFVDILEVPNLQDCLKEHFPNKKLHMVSTGGHNDAVFSIIKEGVLITVENPELYKDTFPNWNILHCPTASWKSSMQNFRMLKKENKKHWWSPNANENPEFIKFVDTWCTQWVGHATETVFDVNCLVINKNLVLINNHNQEVESFLKLHQVDVLVAPLRHRFFWDGGIHCVTNDLTRENQ